MACPAGHTFVPLKKAPFSSVTEHLQNGQRFLFWDYDIIWTEDHLRSSELEPLRRQGDPLADEATVVLGLGPHQDAWKRLNDYINLPEQEQKSLAPKKLVDAMLTVPDWVDWERIERGQAVYWKYCFFINHALLHFSLAGGFGLPKVSKVLTSTGYLAGTKTTERVMETSQFVIDVLSSPQSLYPSTGLGWQSIVQVRCLHSSVRNRLTNLGKLHSKFYNSQDYGVPINQEDLVGTLFSFSSTMWRVMEERMNVFMTFQEREDYLHVWRYIGYLLGIDPQLDPARDVKRANAILDSIVMHLADPDPNGGKLCASLLENMVGWNRMHFVLAENLLGPKVWSLFELKKSAKIYQFLRQILFAMLYLDLFFTSRWQYWAKIRMVLFIQGHVKFVNQHLGGKRTGFELQAEPGMEKEEALTAVVDQAVLRTGIGRNRTGSGGTKASNRTTEKNQQQVGVLLSWSSSSVLILTLAVVLIATTAHFSTA